jgi:hypothetical protein
MTNVINDKHIPKGWNQVSNPRFEIPVKLWLNLAMIFYGQTPFLNQCYWISLNAQLTPKEVQEQANRALICLHFVQTQVKHCQT